MRLRFEISSANVSSGDFGTDLAKISAGRGRGQLVCNRRQVTGHMNVTFAQRPWAIGAIQDAVFALDVEGAFVDSGFDFVNFRPDLMSPELLSTLANCRVVLIDQDYDWDQVLPLARLARGHAIPVMVFFHDEEDRTVPEELTGALHLTKPFDTTRLLKAVFGEVGRHDLPAEQA